MGESEGWNRSAYVVLQMSRLEILACSIAVSNCRHLIELFVDATPESGEILQHLYPLLDRLRHLERQDGPDDEMVEVQLTFEEATILGKAINSYFVMEQWKRLLFFHKRLTSGEVKSHLLAVLRR